MQKPYRKWYNRNNNLYDAFGVEKNPSTTDTNPFRYCGEYFDMESGTIYLRARYYNPSIGRFISRDSFAGKAEDLLSLNLYTYSGTGFYSFTDANTIYDLNGCGVSGGGSGTFSDVTIGVERVGGCTVNEDTGEIEDIINNGYKIGVGAGAPTFAGEGHGEMNYTFTLWSTNIYDIYSNKLYPKIMGK